MWLSMGEALGLCTGFKGRNQCAMRPALPSESTRLGAPLSLLRHSSHHVSPFQNPIVRFLIHYSTRAFAVT